MWEMRTVAEHLLVIPRRHVRSLSELNDTAQLELMATLADYELKGYNIYARGVGSGQRSVAHQHTHLIKTHPHAAHGSLTIKKPYLLVRF